MSMLDAQQHSGAATAHAAQETNLTSMLPQHLRDLPEECAPRACAPGCLALSPASCAAPQQA